MLLYADLLVMISEYLSDDIDSLSRLCLTSRSVCAATIQVLYKKVVLHQLRAIDLFCNTIMTSRRENPNVRFIPQTLWIGPPDYHRSPGIVARLPAIRETLKLLPNLRDLTLTPMAKSFSELFLGLDNCEFALSSLAAPYHTSRSFARFLQSQPSITHLRLHDPDTEPPRSHELVNTINELSTKGLFLPNLQFISADPRVLISLVVGRPVSHAEITVGSCMSPPEREVLADLVQALPQTSVPLTSITHSLRTVRIHLWGTRFLEQLGGTRLQSTVRSLSVRLPQVMRPILLIRTSASIGPIAHISRLFAKELHGFGALDNFEISLDAFKLSELPAGEIAETFGDVNKFAMWKSCCPTLRRVVLYGVTLE